MKSANPHVGFYEADTARTLDANGGNPACNQGGIAVVAFAQNQRNEVRDLGEKSAVVCANAGTKQQTFVLQDHAAEHDAIYAMTTGGFSQVTEDAAPTLMARDFKDPTAVCYGIGRDTFNQGRNAAFSPTFDEELQPTLVAKGPGAVQSGYTVRRLTPTECARLQGFADWWCSDLGEENLSEEEIDRWEDVFETYRQLTDADKKPKSRSQIAKWLKTPHSDAAEYKVWGNGVALPCVYFIRSGIVWGAEKG